MDVDAGIFRIRLVRWQGSSTLPTHTHGEARLIVSLQGTFGERRGSRDCEYDRGATIVREMGESHSDRYAADGGAYVRIAIADSEIGRKLVASSAREIRSASALVTATRLRDEVLMQDAWSALAAQALSYELIANVGRHAEPRARSASPPWIRRLRDILREDFRTTWSLADLARIVDVAPSQIGRHFRRHTGIGIADELRRVRIEAACRLLERGDLSLAKIAAETGFADQSHLARSFRRVLGVPPSAIRRRKRPVDTESDVSF